MTSSEQSGPLVVQAPKPIGSADPSNKITIETGIITEERA